MSDPVRVDPFAGGLDLSDFKPTPSKRPAAQKAAIREVSEANNFPSRAAAKPKAAYQTAFCRSRQGQPARRQAGL